MLRAQRRASWRPAPASASLPGHLCGECVCQMVGLRAGGGFGGGGMNRYTSMCAVVLLSPMLHYWLLFRRGGVMSVWHRLDLFFAWTPSSLCVCCCCNFHFYFSKMCKSCAHHCCGVFFHCSFTCCVALFFLYSVSPFHISL